VELKSRVQPRSVGTEQYLARAGAADCFYDVIESSDSGGIGVDVRIAAHLINHLLMCSKIVGKAAQARNDEVDVRILRREHIDHFRTPHYIGQNRKPEGLRRLAYFSSGHGVMAVKLDTAKAPAGHGMGHHLEDPPGIPAGVHEGEADKALGVTRYNAGNLGISSGVVAVKGCEDNGLLDSGSTCPANVGSNRRVRIPRSCHPVALAGVAMNVDDHGRASLV